MAGRLGAYGAEALLHAYGDTFFRVLLESPWQGGGAPAAQRPCLITNDNTFNRVLPEIVHSHLTGRRRTASRELHREGTA